MHIHVQINYKLSHYMYIGRAFLSFSSRGW